MAGADQASDDLIHEIMKLELEIEKVMALNGNREDYVVKKYRQFIKAKKHKLNKLNGDYNRLLVL